MFFRNNLMSRRMITGLALAAVMPLCGLSAAQAASPAETFISQNIQAGLAILNDKQLSPAQRSENFENVILGMVDMKRIAMFTLGSYANTASQADKDAYAAAFRSYSVAVYKSYLGKYAGQTLQVTGSRQHTPDDFIVTTNMIDPNDRGQKLEIDFRVRTDTGKPELTDFSVAGIWLAIAERDQFSTFLAQNNGSVPALITHIRDVASQYK